MDLEEIKKNFLGKVYVKPGASAPGDASKVSNDYLE